VSPLKERLSVKRM